MTWQAIGSGISADIDKDARPEILTSQFFEFAGADPVRRPLLSLCTVEGFDERH